MRIVETNTDGYQLREHNGVLSIWWVYSHRGQVHPVERYTGEREDVITLWRNRFNYGSAKQRKELC